MNVGYGFYRVKINRTKKRIPKKGRNYGVKITLLGIKCRKNAQLSEEYNGCDAYWNLSVPGNY